VRKFFRYPTVQLMPGVHILDAQLLAHQDQQLFQTLAAVSNYRFVRPLKKQYITGLNY